MSSAGHNSGADEAELAKLTGESDEAETERKPVDIGDVACERLRSFIHRVERLEEEKKTIADDIRDVYAEAKSNGFDPKIMREIVKLRKQEAAERQAHDALLETYLHALGMLD